MLWLVRPRLAVCGHIHESRGAEIIKWDLDSPDVEHREAGSEQWVDPGRGNKKMSFLDLTKKGGRPIANNGPISGDDGLEKHDPGPSRTGPTGSLATQSLQYEYQTPWSIATTAAPDTFQRGLSHAKSSFFTVPKESSIPATVGQSDIPLSSRCDLQVLSNRLGRKETCVVNAAIMASSWPHKGASGKKFNKPIVVDIDLPVWTKQ
jgi:hypothetical protein